MNTDGPYYLLLEKKKDPSSWEQLFSPYRIIRKESPSAWEGKLLLAEQEVGEVRYFSEELRLEVFPLSGCQEHVEGLLAVPAFRALFQSPIIRWAEKQLEVLKDTVLQIEEEKALHAFRLALCNLYHLFPLLGKTLVKEDRKQMKRLLKRLIQDSGRLRDEQVLRYMLEERKIGEQSKLLKMEKHRATLLKDIPSDLIPNLQDLLRESHFALAGYHPKVLVAKSHRRLVKAVHTVHSARDVKAMHKVRRRVRALIALRTMAGMQEDEQLNSLQKVLGRWHDLILLQDLLLKQKQPPLKVLHVLVDVELEVQHLVGEYRQLSSEYWEEMA
ncbi:MAG: CHAD domain-containing protein [Sphaerochaeta sp.]